MNKDEVLVTVSDECLCQIAEYPDGHKEIWHCQYHHSMGYLLRCLKNLVDEALLGTNTHEFVKGVHNAQMAIQLSDEIKHKCLK